MNGFTWTAKRDALLRELRRQGLSLVETARSIGAGCEVEHVRLRLHELGAAAPAPAAGSVDLTAVPRPAPRPAGGRPLIDLSKAPSAMEERFAPERFR